ncbi:MAG: 1-acyl-sn-glycerol-3-phosphate acyltransferase [Chloroflexi bacterium]|nr:1-acyl-sn-glycerol-3-phosphate acyltransferase [Chloroflexota bacterium]MCL5075461.1 1-acyl-sn-glycerol-3-phosphate acyltransferase [Chloroflexota bacterium]
MTAPGYSKQALPRKGAREWQPHKWGYSLVRMLAAPLFRFYCRLSCQGVENVPKHGSLILVSNHLSALDPLVLGLACPRPINFLAKKELFRIPVLSFLFRHLGTIPLDRATQDIEAARMAFQVLRQGGILGIFPEGTRSTSGEMRPFRTGVANFALKLKVPILPVAIVGTDRAMPKRSILPRPAKMEVRFGPTFELSQFYDRPRTPGILNQSTEIIRSRVAILLRQ